MKKHEGFISIVILIVMVLSFIMLLYVVDINKMQALTNFYSRDHDQSLYSSESKLLLCINDEYYLEEKLKPILFEIFRNPNTKPTESIKIDPGDLEAGDSEDNLTLIYEEIEEDKCMKLVSKANIRGNITTTYLSASLVNEIYEMEIPIIDVKALELSLSESYIEEIKRLTHQIETNIDIKAMGERELIYAFQSDKYERVDLKANKLICTREGMNIPYSEFINKNEVFLVFRACKDNYIDLYIDEVHNAKKLSGIIYVEGDLYVKKDFKFSGIIIIKGGNLFVEDDCSFDLEGMLIYTDHEKRHEIPDNLSIKYGSGTIYKYGTYIPDFLDIRVNSIKSY